MSRLADRLLEGGIPDPDMPDVAPGRSVDKLDMFVVHKWYVRQKTLLPWKIYTRFEHAQHAALKSMGTYTEVHTAASAEELAEEGVTVEESGSLVIYRSQEGARLAVIEKGQLETLPPQLWKVPDV
jgi:hypothetical protein